MIVVVVPVVVVVVIVIVVVVIVVVIVVVVIVVVSVKTQLLRHVESEHVVDGCDADNHRRGRASSATAPELYKHGGADGRR